MKLYRVVRRIAVGSEKETEITMFYAAAHIKDVIEKLETDLIDEATEVLAIEYQVNVSILPKTEVRSQTD